MIKFISGYTVQVKVKLVGLRLLHTRVTSSKYFEKRKFFNPDEACIFLISFDAIYMYTYFNEDLSILIYL